MQKRIVCSVLKATGDDHLMTTHDALTARPLWVRTTRILCFTTCALTAVAAGIHASDAADPAVPDASTSTASLSSLESPGEFEALALRDPKVIFDLSLDLYDHRVDDYRCTFMRQERINGKLLNPFIVEVLCRSTPFSVLMIASPESKKIRRALYVEGSLHDKHGRELMLVEPCGWKRLLVSSAKIPIDDKRVMEFNRVTISGFGFKAALEDFARSNTLGEELGVLDLTYDGRGNIDGRPTYVFSRRLPYEGENGRFPAALTVVQLDQEWLMPVEMRTYTDRAGQRLLAHYRLTNVKLNNGLTDREFEF